MTPFSQLCESMIAPRVQLTWDAYSNRCIWTRRVSSVDVRVQLRMSRQQTHATLPFEAGSKRKGF
jgi:hypothetical protein